jgi:hypothetical protein
MMTRKKNGFVGRLAGLIGRLMIRKRRNPSFVNGKRERGKELLIREILDLEWQMFSRLIDSGPSENDHRERLYRTMRRGIHFVLPVDVLESYLDDLHGAQREGRNIIREKFDRREGKLPPSKDNPLIPQIVEIECEWKRAMDQKRSPRSIPNRDEKAFRLYVATELETYSDRTLNLYYRAVVEARQSHHNLVEERYRNRASPSSPRGPDTKKKKSAAHRAA